MMNRRVAPAEAPGKVKKASSWRGARVGGEGAPPAPVARGASFPVATGLWKAEAAPRREARVVPEGAAPRSASSRVAPDGADVEDGLRAGEDGRVAPLLALDDGDGDGLGGSARQRGGGRGAAKVAPAGGGGDAMASVFTSVGASMRAAAASAGKGVDSLKARVRGNKTHEPLEQQYGRLDIGDELDDGNPLHHHQELPSYGDATAGRGRDELEL